MDKPIELIEMGNRKLEIYLDDNPLNPRTEMDNLSQMFCFHRRYNLGDNHNYRSDDFSNWGDFKDFLAKEYNPVIILPLYLYDHSGINIRTTPFPCPWDSGQVGYVLILKDKVKKEYGCKRISNKLKKKLEEMLLSEVNIYDEYLTGSVYGYILYENEEEVDRCWGFYGFDHNKSGLLDNAGFSRINDMAKV